MTNGTFPLLSLLGCRIVTISHSKHVLS